MTLTEPVTRDEPTKALAEIVVADDSEAIRELLAVLVETAGVGRIVGIAEDGRAALDLVLALSPDVVLLDVEMPRMTGLAAAEVISTYRPGTHVILHTGHDNAEVRERAERLGIPLVSKITDAETLAAVIGGRSLAEAAGEPTEIGAVVLAALDRGASESVLVLDAGGDAVFYDSRAAEILELPFPPQPLPLYELRARAEHVTADGAPRSVEERPLFRVLAAQAPVEDVIYLRRGGAITAWRSRAVPIFDALGVLIAAAVYWTPLEAA